MTANPTAAVLRSPDSSCAPLATPASAVTVAALYEHDADGLYRYVLHRCGDPDLADDIVAETFCRAVESLPRFAWRGVPMSSWLYRIARNALASHYRRAGPGPAQRYALEAAPELPDEGLGPEQAVIRAEYCREVQAAVAALPLLHQQIIALRYGQGLRFHEIARRLGRSEGAIKQHLRRARETMRQRLEAAGVADAPMHGDAWSRGRQGDSRY